MNDGGDREGHYEHVQQNENAPKFTKKRIHPLLYLIATGIAFYEYGVTKQADREVVNGVKAIKSDAQAQEVFIKTDNKSLDFHTLVVLKEDVDVEEVEPILNTIDENAKTFSNQLITNELKILS